MYDIFVSDHPQAPKYVHGGKPAPDAIKWRYMHSARTKPEATAAARFFVQRDFIAARVFNLSRGKTIGRLQLAFIRAETTNKGECA